MVGEWLAALEASGLARALRGSTWAYPLVNAGHLLGVSLLIGGIVPLDLRLLGWWKSEPVGPLWRVLTTTAALGLVLGGVFGALLFATRAADYARSPLFLVKMAVVGAGAVNALIAHRRVSRGSGSGIEAGGPAPVLLKVSGGLSLGAWLTALVLGRLVGYF